ncbi:small GTP-binding rab protein [Trypanosoma brucei equiperdum]|uniref:Small GTP-binding rab protein n=1 Tax=Trypanosoma brucei equiperdum TaxID=630700 RepID=A0A3L6LD24_9TRYP|nr:small GTP-binding rab protein [Trypanosoma brucei equiperdum]
MRPEFPGLVEAATETECTEAPTEPEDEQWEDEEQMFVFKVAIVGDYSVGKTSMVKRLLDIPYEKTASSSSSSAPQPPGSSREGEVVSNSLQPLHTTTPTVGTDFFSRVVRNVRAGQHVRLQLWDTAGLERYASVDKSTFRCASAAIVVFDVKNRESFAHVTSQHLDLVMRHNPDISGRHIFVVGNKVDLIDNTEVEDMDRLVTQHELQFELFSAFPDVQYYEVSTLTNYGLREMLHGLCHTLLNDHTTCEEGNIKENGPTPAERGPLHSHLPLNFDTGTTMDGETGTDGTLFTTDGVMASAPSLYSLGSMVTVRSAQIAESGWFTPRERGSEGDTCACDKYMTEEVKESPTHGPSGTDTTLVAEDVDGHEETACSHMHMDPTALLSCKEEERDITLYSVCSALESGVVDNSVAEASNGSGSIDALNMGDETGVESTRQQTSAAPPSVENTARFVGGSQRLHNSMSMDSYFGSLSHSWAATGRNANAISSDDHPEASSHRRRIDDMLRRIDRDAELENSAESRHVAEDVDYGATPVDHGNEKPSKVNLSSCSCFGSKGDRSKRSGC